MKRRRFLGTAMAGVAGAVAGCGGGSDSGTVGSSGGNVVAAPPPAAILTEGLPLRPLDVLPNGSAQAGQFAATLSAAPGEVGLLPGRTTTMWLYNGMAPGPLLELREGQRVSIRFDNRLAEDSTIHWHGLPVPASQDGNPMDPVGPGTTRTYEFDVPPGTAGTYWYHPHPHQMTAGQVAHGLAAPLIVRAADDPLAHLPEVTLFVSGLRLDADAQISPNGPMDWTLGRQGEQLLVNGGRLPVHRVRPGSTQRWRILNATSARYFRLALDGHVFTLVGTDGGLLDAPIAGLSELLLAPAQRVEVVVTVGASPNASYRLRALHHPSGMMGLGAAADADLLTVVTTAEAPAAALPVPPVLRPSVDIGTPVARQRIELTQTGMGMMGGASMGFAINGRTFDPGRVDLATVVGRVELWDIVNRTSMDHPIHVHGTQFQLASRQAGFDVAPAPYAAWIDTVNVPAGEIATIRIRQSMAGKRMFHCHILEHEDAGMMGVLDVRPA
jgi:bilirubin oxidase